MISLNWVKDYVDISDQEPTELAEKITKAGVNVEDVKKSRIDHLVIGEVKECVDHPDSDHLHICQVDVGDKITQIVCGAKNVRKGLKVIVALPGCKLPGDVEIKAGKIRGEESNGMICALYELGLEKKTEETYAQGIAELDTDLPVGTDANIYLGQDDTVLELDIHKHRNNDCFYHIGFAYIIGAILNRKVTLPSTDFKTISDDINKHFSLRVETKKCPYYLAKMVTDVKIGQSPKFIQDRLISAGMRPINNLVDISNYVMLEFGQPLHFFDKDKVGDTILVRDAKEGEKIVTLDDKTRVLKNSDIVITDGKKPICIAGVMGGQNTEIDENTKTILIESAIFDGVSIRRTALHLDLRSEASLRYGKGLNYEYTLMAIERACHLLEKYAGAKVLSGMVKHDVLDKTPKVVRFKTASVNSLVGLNFTDEDVKTELKRLDFPYELKNGEFVVTIPNRRLDIENNVNDVAEEITRLYGYHNLPSTLPKTETKRGEYIGDVKIKKDTSRRLRALGLNEVKTYTLISEEMSKLFNYENKKCIKVPNPMMSDRSVIRTGILSSLLAVYDYNKGRKVKDVMIYEVARVYDSFEGYREDLKVGLLMCGDFLANSWSGQRVKADFYVLKGVIENLLNFLGFKNRYTFERASFDDFHPGMCAKIILDREVIGVIGRVHPNLRKEDVYLAELSLTKIYNKQIKSIKFKEASKYPEMVKDVAFVMDETLESEVVRGYIKRAGGKLLSSIEEFDVYRNVEPGKKSVAYSLTFKDDTKTLVEDEVMSVFNKIIKEVEAKGIKMRQ